MQTAAVIATGSFLSVLICGAFCGFIAGALLADRIGRKATFMLSAIGAATMIGLYTQLPISNDAMLFLGFPLGLFANATFAPMGAFITEMDPTLMLFMLPETRGRVVDDLAYSHSESESSVRR